MKHGMKEFCFIIFFVSMNYATLTQAETKIHQQGNSTAIITQEGGSKESTTEVIKTPDGQKIVTRDGKNTDITIQRSGSSTRNTPPSNRASESKSDCSASGGKGKEQASSNHSSTAQRSGCVKPEVSKERGNSNRSSIAEGGRYEVPTAEEYKQQMLQRMRPLSPQK